METDKPEDNVSQLRPVAAQAAAGAIGDALERAEGAVAPEPAAEPVSPPAVTPAAPVPHQSAGIPSEHQDHALNLMSDTIQPQYDRFKSWSENISTEINARTSKFEAEQQEREVQFEATQSRLAEEHEKEIDALRSLQSNVGIGFKVLTDAMKAYTELAKPVGRNLREASDEQEEGDQQ